jgi:hypothetical protein
LRCKHKNHVNGGVHKAQHESRKKFFGTIDRPVAESNLAG